MKSIVLSGKSLELAKAVGRTSGLIREEISKTMEEANKRVETLEAQGQAEVGAMIKTLFLYENLDERQRPTLDLRYLTNHGLAFLNMPNGVGEDGAEQQLS